MRRKTKTVSSRISAETIMELRFLKRELGVNQSVVIQSAIHHFYQETKAKKPGFTRYELFEKTGFLGTVRAEEDLSETYKEKPLINISIV
ncbi:MAG: hypothetical protein JSR46_12565 [Verrucomicrobia bacterium]|nr:hypothetical protein [Verrucomicrobiota bacterium]